MPMLAADRTTAGYRHAPVFPAPIVSHSAVATMIRHIPFGVGSLGSSAARPPARSFA